jgi:tRNA threonylcarbamoyladenosine biosynthesis protein TsaB
MLLLAVETSTARSSVALATPDGVLAAAELGRDRRHGEFVSPAIAQLLHHAGRAVGDLTHVAAGTGPGLYTGLRVGLVTAATIAATHDLPCVAVPGPDALAHRVRHTDRRVAVVLDARRKEVYLGRYDTGDGTARRRGELAVGTPEEAAGAIGDGDPLLLVGDGTAVVAEHLRRAAEEGGRPLDLRTAGPDTGQPTAADLALVALQRLERGEEGDGIGGPQVLRPLYLREADARIGWEERGRLHGGAGQAPDDRTVG